MFYGLWFGLVTMCQWMNRRFEASNVKSFLSYLESRNLIGHKSFSRRGSQTALCEVNEGTPPLRAIRCRTDLSKSGIWKKDEIEQITKTHLMSELRSPHCRSSWWSWRSRWRSSGSRSSAWDCSTPLPSCLWTPSVPRITLPWATSSKDNSALRNGTSLCHRWEAGGNEGDTLVQNN